MKNIINNTEIQSYNLAGSFTLVLRLVVGWTYFSAFWRRLFLANKLDPEASGYIGEKFNHFLPNALGIKPIIEYLVSNPETLWYVMTVFTLIEGVVGLLFMFGLLTRLMSIGVFSLAFGILLGAGWIGTTCLDEWQIGVLGIAAGFAVFLTGSGKYSLDNWLNKQKPEMTNRKWFRVLGSGVLPIPLKKLHKIVFIGAMSVLFLTLFTNQYFHGGVLGTLHNKSVKPKIEISDAGIENGILSFQVFRVEGVDVYGSFLIGLHLENENGTTILEFNGADLADFPMSNIRNKYIAKVKPGGHSLIIPLGAKATLLFGDEKLKKIPKGTYKLVLTDVSDVEWTTKIII